MQMPDMVGMNISWSVTCYLLIQNLCDIGFQQCRRGTWCFWWASSSAQFIRPTSSPKAPTFSSRVQAIPLKKYSTLIPFEIVEYLCENGLTVQPYTTSVALIQTT